jgi:hypothetical protein
LLHTEKVLCAFSKERVILSLSGKVFGFFCEWKGNEKLPRKTVKLQDIKDENLVCLQDRKLTLT